MLDRDTLISSLADQIDDVYERLEEVQAEKAALQQRIAEAHRLAKICAPYDMILEALEVGNG
jgi:hypothetical protein